MAEWRVETTDAKLPCGSQAYTDLGKDAAEWYHCQLVPKIIRNYETDNNECNVHLWKVIYIQFCDVTAGTQEKSAST